MNAASVPLKHLIRINPEALGEDTPPDREFRYIDIASVGRGKLVEQPELMTFGEAPSRARRVVRQGDTLISTVRTYLRAVWTSTGPDQDLVASTGFACLRPKSGIDPRFLGWLAQSDLVVEDVVARSVGVSYPAINAAAIGTIKVTIPSIEDQGRIASYLERETARIDALVDKKRALVTALLEAQPIAASMALLGTIDGPGPLHARFPDRWERVPFRWLFEEIDERSEDGSEQLMSVSQTRGVIAQSELGDRHQYAETLAGYKLCRKDDLVINRMWVYYGALGVAPGTGLISPDYSVFRSKGRLNATFAAQILRTPAYVGEMTRLVRGVGAAFQGAVRKPRLHPRELGQIVMPVPPADQQTRLLRELASSESAVTKRVGLVEQSIALLAEKRRALITAAMSRKLNVTEAA